MAARRLVDPRGIAADPGREYLPDSVGDEIRAREPGEPLYDAARAEQQLPAHSLGRNGDDGQEGREREPAEACGPQDMGGLAEVDLPEQVGRREAGHDERRDKPEPA